MAALAMGSLCSTDQNALKYTSMDPLGKLLAAWSAAKAARRNLWLASTDTNSTPSSKLTMHVSRRKSAEPHTSLRAQSSQASEGMASNKLFESSIPVPP
eukprot:CAMPEP_0181231532 /NCGR_PEP_ID=MMETSP1096-20121128/35160_1 /TAXON_ID=156174 ORGANISM="Chrysochromulina ericina, Strain CCMP281" /NCGR_SAMPLE_ID=MMETSP1096 /ASSEMBLY_ACC=CAM_ASM_000453 /LENGTH=98 /DNA_ID=CAMNT_0023325587 /DNA_START=259 /DNA_END=555 /DNA_ORIENTATION=+